MKKSNKIARKPTSKLNISTKTNISAEAKKTREAIIRKSYALTKEDIHHIHQIKDKCLNQKVVLNDSHIVRIALMLASKLQEDALIKASSNVPKLIMGRPRIK